jgi:hypothetical protein
MPVVDGDLHISFAVRVWLEPYGFEITVADDGEAGLRACEGATFDWMIVDHRQGEKIDPRFVGPGPVSLLGICTGLHFNEPVAWTEQCDAVAK